MKQNDKWTIKFRERMEGYTEAPPSEVWEKLDGELSSAVTSERHRFFRIFAVAAVILLLVSAGLFLFYFPGSEKSNMPDIVARPFVDKNTSGSQQPVISVNHNNPKIESPVKYHKVVDKESVQSGDAGDSFIQLPADTICSLSEEASGNIPEKKDELPEKKYRQSELSSSVADYTVMKTPKRKRSWSMGISVGNNMIASAESHYGFSNLNRPGGIPRVMDLSQSDRSENAEEEKAAAAYQQIMLKNINSGTTTDIKHRFPVTFGISLRKDVSDRFSLETGLMYTLLSSDLKAGEDIYYSQEQKLHYLGIPLKAGWHFVKKERFSLYLSAGGMVEKCIKSQLKTHYEMQNESSFVGSDHLDVKRLQWSVLASAGAQFNITGHFGVYAEPGVVYYFDDGTNISTIRKEKPFNVNLQIGLRFGF